MRVINVKTFKHTLRDVHKNTENRKFCFVLGAGASKISGIPTGNELAQKWFSEIKERLGVLELSDWIDDENVNEDDLGSSYGKIYRKRFENDKTSGYEFLVQAMKAAKPSLGHILLGQILSYTSGHCVLTTNFDSLIESSIYQFTDKTPLVCGHESLSGYARPSQTHPLIVKIHRDLLLAPKSDYDEINTLAPSWKDPLDHIFNSYIPIIIGYGGNDGSLMSYFELMNKPSNFFWCGLDENTLSDRIKNLIIKHNGCFVRIIGFDELMHELLWVFDEIKPWKEQLGKISDQRIQSASKQMEGIEGQNTGLGAKELSALEYGNMIDSEPNLIERERICREALDKYPTTGWLWWRFTYFLHFIKRDYSKLEYYYKKALELNAEEGGLLANYALFLEKIKFDYLQAERYYLKALSIEPLNGVINANFATFLAFVKRDFDGAEEYFQKALLQGENVLVKCMYATFLSSIKKKHDETEMLFQKLLNSECSDSARMIVESSYANFLSNKINDYVKAEKIYLKLLSIAPENPHYNANYSQLLILTNRKEEALKFIRKALLLNGKCFNDIEIEMWFYLYAHYSEHLKEAESKIQSLLSKGVNSLGWNLEMNIRIAEEDGHPNLACLKDLATKISSLVPLIPLLVFTLDMWVYH